MGGVEKLNEDVRGADLRQCPPKGFGAEVQEPLVALAGVDVTAAWIWHQLLEATPWGRRARLWGGKSRSNWGRQKSIQLGGPTCRLPKTTQSERDTTRHKRTLPSRRTSRELDGLSPRRRAKDST